MRKYRIGLFILTVIANIAIPFYLYDLYLNKIWLGFAIVVVSEIIWLRILYLNLKWLYINKGFGNEDEIYNK